MIAAPLPPRKNNCGAFPPSSAKIIAAHFPCKNNCGAPPMSKRTTAVPPPKKPRTFVPKKKPIVRKKVVKAKSVVKPKANNLAFDDDNNDLLPSQISKSLVKVPKPLV